MAKITIFHLTRVFPEKYLLNERKNMKSARGHWERAKRRTKRTRVEILFSPFVVVLISAEYQSTSLLRGKKLFWKYVYRVLLKNLLNAAVTGAAGRKKKFEELQ
jgi:hypothetical protein